MFRGKFAAFVAAMSVLVLFGGCGGGGGGVAPVVPTFVVGTVVDESVPPNPIKDAAVSVPDKPGVTAVMTGTDGKFRINVTGQEGLLLLEVRHPSIGVMQQLVNLADAILVGNTKELRLISSLVIKRSYREVHLEEAPIRVAGVTLLEYEEADDPKPTSILVNKVLAGPQNLTLAYEYKVGDPRVVLEDYVGHWYLYPSDEGRVIASAVFEGPRPDRTRVFVTLVLVRPTDSIPPTVTVEPIESTVSGTLIIKGTATDGEDARSTTGITVIELEKLTVVKDSRDYDDYHFEDKPSGIKLVTLRYNGQDHPITPDSSGSFSVAVDTVQIPDGPVTFEVKATDKADNTSVKTLTTTVDNVPDPKPDLFVEMETIDRPLVMVDEDARPFDESTWPKEGTPGSFGDLVVGSHDELIVHMGGGGDVFSLPREGGVNLWPHRAPGNGTSTFSPQGYLYVSDLGGDVKRFDPATGKVDKHIADARLGNSWLIKADNTGVVWVYDSNKHFTCLSADLTPFMVDKGSGPELLTVKVDAVDIQGFAADLSLDSLIWYRDIGGGATQIIRRRISTGEDFVLHTFPGLGLAVMGIILDHTHDQVIVLGGFTGTQGQHIIQLGKKDGQWGELYRTSLTDPASDNWNHMVRGSSFNEYYVYSTGASLAKRFRYQ